MSFYNQADVFVFPSKTDTFGLVMLEAMACGTPVAAYPVASPIDVIHNGVSGAMDEDLKEACLLAQEVLERMFAVTLKIGLGNNQPILLRVIWFHFLALNFVIIL